MTIGWIDTTYSYEEAIELSNEAKEHGVILLPSHFKDAFNNFDIKYSVWYGSRSSAKTYVKAIQYLYKASKQKYFRGLFTRETQIDARNSSYQLFDDLITKIYPFLQEEFLLETSKMRVTNIKNGNFMKGASFENLPRSLAEFTDFWVDEPITRESSIQRKDLLDISGTLRNSYGMKSQNHLTFNPISDDTFIFSDFFSENKIFEASILLANYQDNVFCPPEKVEELEWYKEIDIDRWLVDSCGKWGSPKVQSPYFATIKNYNIGETYWHKDILKPIWWSWDFNKRASWGLFQTYDRYEILNNENNFVHKDRGGVYCLEECQYDSVGESVFKDGVKEVIRRFWGHKFIITGDPAGSAATSGKYSNYYLIQVAFEELNYPTFLYEFKGIKRKATETDISRTIVNALIAYYAENFVIDRSCKQLWSDLNKCEALPSGKIDKNKMENSTPRYGDLSDCLRYFTEVAEGHTFQNLGELSKYIRKEL